MKEIPICFCTDENYVLPTCVAITSLIQNKQPETKYDIYVICNQVGQELKHKLKACELKDTKINIINAIRHDFIYHESQAKHVSLTTCLKFDICDQIPQYDKILYIDGDTIVKNDLTPLYNIVLQDEFCAVVRDLSGEQQLLNKKIGVKKYFNAGVILYNAKKIRAEKVSQLLWKTYSTHPYLPCTDQDVQNLVFQTNVKWIDPKFNFMLSNLLESNIDINYVNQECDTNYKDIQDLNKQALIFHLTNRIKPWNDKSAVGYDLWKKYYKLSPCRSIHIKYNKQQIMWHKFIFNKIIEDKKTTIKILGIPIIKVKYTPNYKKVYFWGLKIRSKKRKNVQNPQEFKKQEIQALHTEVFPKYKNSLLNKDVVLIATGPSLQNFIPLKDVLYVGVNRAYTYDKIILDYLFIQDYTIGEIVLGEVEKYKEKNKTKLFYGDIVGVAHIPVECAKRAGAERYYTDSFREPNFKFTHQINQEPLGDFNSIVFSAMQFILWCHPKRVYIVGCDCSLGGYFNSNEKNTFCVPATEMVNRWKNLRDFAKEFYSDVEIVSINPVGLKGVFKDVYQTKEK